MLAARTDIDISLSVATSLLAAVTGNESGHINSGYGLYLKSRRFVASLKAEHASVSTSSFLASYSTRPAPISKSYRNFFLFLITLTPASGLNFRRHSRKKKSSPFPHATHQTLLTIITTIIFLLTILS
ncbi:hypothetical protein B0J11DRAFT_269110 [Dendryphion nanum]|uniref:Uncharacterized protein n=1 Tax=Dendryphion nanum TaxID=256645 RepID=A0A9P9IQ14_9PLEO|nr:hypothetical protein B0J11DRAFT_269110 [Dendryphion nanum]